MTQTTVFFIITTVGFFIAFVIQTIEVQKLRKKNIQLMNDGIGFMDDYKKIYDKYTALYKKF